MIATAYKLPFKFEHSDVEILSGRPVSILVRTATPDATGLVSETLRRFTRTAFAGAFGSRYLAPWNTEFAAVTQPSGDPCEVLVRADPCRVASEAWVVLCHLLLKVHRALPVEVVEVVVDGDSSPLALMQAAESTYPSAFEPLPFVLDDTQPEGGGYSFFITLDSPLTPTNEATLNDRLDAWVQVVAHGGYGLAPIDPATDYVEPYGDGVEAYDSTVEWAVFKLRADPVAAMDALLNVLACFHARYQPIRSVEIG
jgi:hypothetical protein